MLWVLTLMFWDITLMFWDATLMFWDAPQGIIDTEEYKDQKHLKDLNKQRTLAQQPQPQPRDDIGSLGYLKTKRTNGKIPPA